MDGDGDAYLDQVLIGGREPAAITVVDYDEQWPLHFQETAERVCRVLGERALQVEHIGSTSVPGLAAKPTSTCFSPSKTSPKRRRTCPR